MWSYASGQCSLMSVRDFSLNLVLIVSFAASIQACASSRSSSEAGPATTLTENTTSTVSTDATLTPSPDQSEAPLVTPASSDLPASPAVTPTVPGTPVGSGVLTDQAGDPIEYLMRLFVPTELAWVGEHMGHQVIVYAGSDGSDSEQGVVIVVRKGTVWDPIGARFETQVKAGALMIVDAVDSRLILEAEDGRKFYFDVPAGSFVSSLDVSVPTMTPGPTVTPLPTGPVLHDDDAPDSSGTTFEESPINAPLQFHISPPDDEDWFLFLIGPESTATVTLVSFTGDHSFKLYDADNLNTLARGTVAEGETESLPVSGSESSYYYVRVAASGQISEEETTYVIRMSSE